MDAGGANRGFAGFARLILEIEIEGKAHRAEIVRRSEVYLLKLDGGGEQELHASFPEPGIVQFLLGAKSYAFRVSGTNGELLLDHRGQVVHAELRDPRSLRSRRAGAGGEAGPKKVTAPMPGKVVRLLVSEGDTVEAGAGVVVIEAMKMQNELKSPKAGKVQRVAVAEGATVNPGDTLVVVE